MKNLDEILHVSRETICALKSYQSLLIEWQAKFNLVSNASLSDAWNRHFLDSVQLYDYIPKTAEKLIDLGSGAGFPGLVISIMAKNRMPYLNVTLVESIKKKTLFLNAVKESLGLDVRIENQRIESLAPEKYDVITSRALSSLSKLLDYAHPFCRKNTLCVFPKGRSYEEELCEAHKKHSFDCEIIDNKISTEGKILLISNIKQHKGEKNAKNFSNSKS